MTFEIRVQFKSDHVADNLNLREIAGWLRFVLAMLTKRPRRAALRVASSRLLYDVSRSGDFTSKPLD
jgi:hypothetical protein